MFKLTFPLYIVMLSLLVSCPMQARQNYSEEGIKTYIRLCKQCHGNPYKGAAMLKKKEWKGLFEGGDEKMSALHANNKKAMKTLNKSYYKNRRRHLVKFLISSGSDSGVVPACDGNFCGD